MAQKKQAEIITRLIAEVKAILLKLNTHTTDLKNKQGSLSADQINVLNANPFTTTLLNKLNSAITDLSAYMTSTQINQLLGGKQATLTPAQLSVLAANPFLDEYKSAIQATIDGGNFLGDLPVLATDDFNAIVAKITSDFGATHKPGDHIEIIQPSSTPGDTKYITYTWSKSQPATNPITYEWRPGAEKITHLKGGTIDAYTKAEADAKYAPLADVSMDDAGILALEAITITT